jgi:hypothetical protein
VSDGARRDDVIVVEGGLVQHFACDDPEIEVFVFDLDTLEGTDEDLDDLLRGEYRADSGQEPVAAFARSTIGSPRRSVHTKNPEPSHSTRRKRMQNVTMKREGKSKLVIEIDLSKDLGPSASGKTIMVATTRGNAPVPETSDCFVGINCFRYATAKKSK